MEPIQCNGCTQCCEWGNDLGIRPRLTQLETKKYENEPGIDGQPVLKAVNGHCVYLNKGRNPGCSIHKDRPSTCRTFDCRLLYQQLESMSGATFIKVALKGAEKLKDD